MDSIKICKTFLGQAARLATMCVTDQTKESKFWKLACDYVAKAQQLDCPWDRLSSEEMKMLETGIPQPIKCAFYTTSALELQIQNQIQRLPPPPSEWETIHALKEQIEELETERNALPTPQQYEKLKQELQRSKQVHELNLLKAKEDRQKLEEELKTLGGTLKEHEDVYDESEIAKMQFRKLKNRMMKIQDRHQKESHAMYVEIEEKHHELRCKVDQIDSLNKDITALKQVNNQLEASLGTFQRIWEDFFPQLDEEQKEILARMISGGNP